MTRFTSKIFIITITFLPTNYYLYRFETPWKRKITAPQAAAMSLRSQTCLREMLMAVICQTMKHDIDKAASFHINIYTLYTAG